MSRIFGVFSFCQIVVVAAVAAIAIVVVAAIAVAVVVAAAIAVPGFGIASKIALL